MGESIVFGTQSVCPSFLQYIKVLNGFYPHAFKKKKKNDGEMMNTSVCPSIKLSPPEPLGGI